MQKKEYRKLVMLDEARHIWMERLKPQEHSPLKAESVHLSQSKGRTLAKGAAAQVSSPAFHGAAMDGIAVKAEDTFGASTHRPLKMHIGKNAFWINTGHPLPDHCNAIVMREYVFPEEENTVSIEQAVYPWQHVRKMGEDMVETEMILPPGTLIGAYEIGALAAGGIKNPTVFVKPKVAIIPSGSELLALDDTTAEILSTGAKLPEFNSLVIKALVEDAGGEAVILPIVPDVPEQISAAMRQAASMADLVVIIAGSSAGSKDYTAALIAQNGELWVHGISIMPGKPTALGKVFDKPVIGVPGYPVSAIISFEEFGQTLLALWQKRSHPARPQRDAQPFQALPSKPGLEERVRVKLGQVDDKLFAVPLPRGAGTMTSLSRADGIISVPPSMEGLSAGQSFPVTLIRSEEHINGAALAIGSHDNCLELIDSFLRINHPPLSLTSAHVGSLGGLMAVKNKQCHLAGSHLLDPQSGLYNQSAIAEHLADIPVRLVHLVDREQGLMVPKGNPQAIKSLEDLAREDVKLINRQRGSGTRLLLDWELSCLKLERKHIRGYEDEEYTHMNVAVAVRAGRASTGLGIKAAANALGLDFIPVGVEKYDLVIPKAYWDDQRIQAILQVIGTDEFKKAVLALGGYGVEDMGEIVWES